MAALLFGRQNISVTDSTVSLCEAALESEVCSCLRINRRPDLGSACFVHFESSNCHQTVDSASQFLLAGGEGNAWGDPDGDRRPGQTRHPAHLRSYDTATIGKRHNVASKHVSERIWRQMNEAVAAEELLVVVYLSTRNNIKRQVSS